MKNINLTEDDKKLLKDYNFCDDTISSSSHLIFNANELILTDKEEIKNLYIVTEGKAKTERYSDEGKNVIVSKFIEKGFIGEIELLNDLSYSVAQIQAISDFHLIAVPYAMIKEELKTNIVFLNILIKNLAHNLLYSSNNYLNTTLHDAKYRLSKYILDNSHNNIFADVLTEVATSTGMSYRHMFRILEKMCNDKILEKTKSGYKILNINALKAE